MRRSRKMWLGLLLLALPVHGQETPLVKPIDLKVLKSTPQRLPSEVVQALPKRAASATIVHSIGSISLPNHRWIGVRCEPVSESLRRQLQIDYGLLVLKVVEAAPAEEAGIQAFDILQSLDDEPLQEAADLGRELQRNRAEKVEFALLRDGRPMFVEVKPSSEPQRPAIMAIQRVGSPKTQVDMIQVESRIRQLRSANPGEVHGVQIVYVRPGFVLPKGHLSLRMPKNLSIEVKEPPASRGAARIVVKRNEEEWTVDESKIGDLPSEVQFHVSRLMGRETALLFPRPLRFKQRSAPSAIFFASPTLPPLPDPRVEKELRKEISDLKSKIDIQQKLLEQLQQKIEKLEKK